MFDNRIVEFLTLFVQNLIEQFFFANDFRYLKFLNRNKCCTNIFRILFKKYNRCSKTIIDWNLFQKNLTFNFISTQSHLWNEKFVEKCWSIFDKCQDFAFSKIQSLIFMFTIRKIRKCWYHIFFFFKNTKLTCKWKLWKKIFKCVKYHYSVNKNHNQKIEHKWKTSMRNFMMLKVVIAWIHFVSNYFNLKLMWFYFTMMFKKLRKRFFNCIFHHSNVFAITWSNVKKCWRSIIIFHSFQFSLKIVKFAWLLFDISTMSSTRRMKSISKNVNVVFEKSWLVDAKLNREWNVMLLVQKFR